MKRLILAIAILSLAGCASTGIQPVKCEVQKVDVPVPYIPAPPDKYDQLKQLPLQTSKLNDKSDAGTVAQAYKADVFLLKSLRQIYEEIINQYQQGAVDNTKTQQKIDQLFQKAIPAPPSTSK